MQIIRCTFNQTLTEPWS